MDSNLSRAKDMLELLSQGELNQTIDFLLELLSQDQLNQTIVFLNRLLNPITDNAFDEQGESRSCQNIIYSENKKVALPEDSFHKFYDDLEEKQSKPLQNNLLENSSQSNAEAVDEDEDMFSIFYDKVEEKQVKPLQSKVSDKFENTTPKASLLEFLSDEEVTRRVLQNTNSAGVDISRKLVKHSTTQNIVPTTSSLSEKSLDGNEKEKTSFIENNFCCPNWEKLRSKHPVRSKEIERKFDLQNKKEQQWKTLFNERLFCVGGKWGGKKIEEGNPLNPDLKETRDFYRLGLGMPDQRNPRHFLHSTMRDPLAVPRIYQERRHQNDCYRMLQSRLGEGSELYHDAGSSSWSSCVMRHQKYLKSWIFFEEGNRLKRFSQLPVESILSCQNSMKEHPRIKCGYDACLAIPVLTAKGEIQAIQLKPKVPRKNKNNELGKYLTVGSLPEFGIDRDVVRAKLGAVSTKLLEREITKQMKNECIDPNDIKRRARSFLDQDVYKTLLCCSLEYLYMHENIYDDKEGDKAQKIFSKNVVPNAIWIPIPFHSENSPLPPPKQEWIGLCEGCLKPFVAAALTGAVFIGGIAQPYFSREMLLANIFEIIETLGDANWLSNGKIFPRIRLFVDAGSVSNDQVSGYFWRAYEVLEDEGFDVSFAWWGQLKKPSDEEADRMKQSPIDADNLICDIDELAVKFSQIHKNENDSLDWMKNEIKDITKDEYKGFVRSLGEPCQTKIHRKGLDHQHASCTDTLEFIEIQQAERAYRLWQRKEVWKQKEDELCDELEAIIRKVTL
eukprot:g4290.t1